jgi:formate-dependent nitrite reductase membrane component NrfD
MTTNQVKGVGHFAEHGEDWIARAAEEDLVPPTTSTDWGGIEFLKSLGGVNLAGGVSVSRRSVDQVIEETESDSAGRRVYDAPAKGVLWGWQVPAYIWTKAVATGTVACSILSRQVGYPLTSMEQALSWILALVFLALTAGLLVWDLDRPDRFLYVLFRPNWRSWLVRGAYILTSLAGMVTLLVFTLWLGWWPLLRLFEILTLILAILGAVYTAFLFGQAAGRDLWQSPLSPIRMLNQAFLAGSATLIIIAPHSFEAWLQLIGTSLALNLLILIFEVISPHSSEESARAVRLMSTGRYGIYFWFGIAAGTVVPLILCFSGPAPAVGVSAAVLILVGIYLTEFVWVRVPQLIALS